MAGPGMLNVWGGGVKGPVSDPFKVTYDTFIDPSGQKNAITSAYPTCECPACMLLRKDSASEQKAYQTNREVSEEAYRFIVGHVRSMTNDNGEIQAGAVVGLVTQFAIEQLKRREQYYQRRFQDIRLEHVKQLEGFMRRELTLAKKAGASAKHSVPNTEGRLFRDPEAV